MQNNLLLSDQHKDNHFQPLIHFKEWIDPEQE